MAAIRRDSAHGYGPSQYEMEYIAALEAERDSLGDSCEAMDLKIHALSAHETRGCSYDQPGDICLHHSPKLLALEAQLVEEKERADSNFRSLERVKENLSEKHSQAKQLREALEYVAGFSYAGGKCYGDLPIVKAALAKGKP